MRTTLTLDPDVEALLKQTMREQGKPFKQVLNNAVRAALGAQNRGPPPRFRQRSFGLGRPRVELTKALALAAELDDQHTLTRYRP